MMFERKMWVRFLTKEDTYDISNETPSRYIMDLFNRAKLEFLSSMNKAIRGRNIPQRKKWKYPTKIEEEKETCGEECPHCQENILQVKKMYPCRHRNHVAKKEEED